MTKQLSVVVFSLGILTAGCAPAPSVEYRLTSTDLKQSTRQPEKSDRQKVSADETRMQRRLASLTAELVRLRAERESSSPPIKAVNLFLNPEKEPCKTIVASTIDHSRDRTPQKEPEPIQIAGKWRSSACGSILQIEESGSTISISVLQSETLRWGRASLQRNGEMISGTATFASCHDATAQRRSTSLKLRIISADELNCETEHVAWDGFGNETRRSPMYLRLIRVSPASKDSLFARF
ncbi:MAG: hypothetical protein EXS05_04860 [Planctomycetaceae bacterium]|nr:hypothetical protein [Planctomycetaceae bacterium]